MTKREEEIATTSATLQTNKVCQNHKKSSINKVGLGISKVEWGERKSEGFRFNGVINIDSKYNEYGNDDVSVFFFLSWLSACVYVHQWIGSVEMFSFVAKLSVTG